MNFYCLTDKGKVRATNEDFAFVSDKSVGPLGNLFVIADGMGGENAGDYASEFAVKKVVELLRNEEEDSVRPDGVVEVMRDVISETNWQLFEKARSDPEKIGMGTTMVTATFLDGVLYVSNIGDSRLYVQRGKNLYQITLDHSYVQEMVRNGEITEEAAKHHKYKSRITRAVGAESMVHTDFFSIPLDDVDRVLMCTDGLTNMVSDDDISSVLSEDIEPKQQAKSLLDKALEAGGKDNITIVVIDPKKGE
ncbi:MAG: Stp1/IreP family PP2C-type Ser/Thr phosphatase [Lachnospiraceae bacterium]|uniref:Stp1/IreP family PP2C-type Ser/Thr phosphatase n=1 Tax=Candidatus Weimeria bifida TaxID=2599074 RepID=A0A6N7IZQ1_9FIRM|nr:Stp1/IreP family PP2C-type Ser/Thr phosphatase [Candidatus Weimeria bifida]RRF96666.1 MAG: Stp1/IreP family PP2C-type Ser/Thr phosphatase [Lachnospiraceae bacterium]